MVVNWKELRFLHSLSVKEGDALAVGLGFWFVLVLLDFRSRRELLLVLGTTSNSYIHCSRSKHLGLFNLFTFLDLVSDALHWVSLMRKLLKFVLVSPFLHSSLLG